MKITDISILCKWEKLAFYQILICPPVYVCVWLQIHIYEVVFCVWLSVILESLLYSYTFCSLIF